MGGQNRVWMPVPELHSFQCDASHCCLTYPAGCCTARCTAACSQLYIAVLNCMVGISRAAHLDVRAVTYHGIGNEWLDWLRELDAEEEQQEEEEGAAWCRK